MKKILFRVGAIAVILAGTIGLRVSPAACDGEGCGQCGYECLTFDDCFDDLGAQWFDQCICVEDYCVTVTNWECPPE